MVSNIARRFPLRFQARIGWTTLPEYVGQAVIAAGMAVGQALVVETHQMQDRGVKIVNVDRIFSDVDAVLVRFAVAYPGFTPAPASQEEKTQ
jgi:hypothetical protein